jgi:hypothetical protein
MVEIKIVQCEFKTNLIKTTVRKTKPIAEITFLIQLGKEFHQINPYYQNQSLSNH